MTVNCIKPDRIGKFRVFVPVGGVRHTCLPTFFGWKIIKKRKNLCNS